MILVALGANLAGPAGTPAQALVAACAAMAAKGVVVKASSRIWRSPPWPVSDQPWYSNAVVRVETSLPPERLRETLAEIETDFGRVRARRNEARVLDLDLIAYDDEVFDTAELMLPHPRLRERAFVLMPLREVAPGWLHPVTGATVEEMIAGLPAQVIEAGEALL